MTARKPSAAKATKAPARKPAAKPDRKAELLPGELPGAAMYRHPDTGERISRRTYVDLMAERNAAATADAWAAKLDDDGNLDLEV